MGTGIAHAGDVRAQPAAEAAGAPVRVLVVYETGRRGAAALREAAELVSGGAELAVVTLAPQAKTLRCCGGGGAGPYNCAIRDVAAEELLEARTLLGTLAGRASYTALTGTPKPPLTEWAARGSFDLVLVPARRFGRGGGALAREVRAAAGAHVRVIT